MAKKKTRVDPAPGREHRPASADEVPAIHMPRRRRAAVVGEKKRKRASRQCENNEEDRGAEIVIEEESVETAEGSKWRQSKGKSTASLVTSPQAATLEVTRFGPASLLRKRDSGIRVPKSINEAGEADRMLWGWRHAGKPWADITRKWTELTGRIPGSSTLSVRFIKLQENFAQSGGADDILLLKYKEEVEGEMEDVLWQKVSSKIMANHDANIPANQLRKRYNALKQSGFEIGAELVVDEGMVDDPEGIQDARTAAADASTQPETAELASLLVDYSNSESDM